MMDMKKEIKKQIKEDPKIFPSVDASVFDLDRAIDKALSMQEEGIIERIKEVLNIPALARFQKLIEVKINTEVKNK